VQQVAYSLSANTNAIGKWLYVQHGFMIKKSKKNDRALANIALLYKNNLPRAVPYSS
jgi:ABC-type phosphate transport system substrate-binding protein